MPANVEKAFDFAQESTKQILTLSVAILTLTITFQTDIVSHASGGRWLLAAAWIAYVISIVFGLLTLMNLAGNLERPAGNLERPAGNLERPADASPSIYRGSIRFSSMSQVIIFGIGIVFTLVYGVVAFP